MEETGKKKNKKGEEVGSEKIKSRQEKRKHVEEYSRTFFMNIPTHHCKAYRKVSKQKAHETSS